MTPEFPARPMLQDFWRRAWDVFVGLCATASALVLPVELVLDVLMDVRFGVFDRLFLGVFVVDLGVRVVETRRLHRTLREAQWRQRRGYVGIGLVCDVLAVLPFSLAAGHPIQLLRLFKLYRVGVLMRRWSRRQIRHASMLRLTFFSYWLLLSAHWITCGWAALHGPESRTDDAWTVYLDALYWCVTTLTTVGYGDVTPANNAQTLYAIGTMILGVGVYAYLIGNIAGILANMDPMRAQYVQQRERLTAFMQYRSLPAALQQRIRDYYDYLWEKRRVYDETRVLKELPPSLQAEVSLFLKRDLIGNVPLFSGATDAFIREVALDLEAVVYPPGDFIIRFGEQGRDMFFISRGTVEVLAPDGETVLRTLADGDYFGEIALFLDEPRTASVRTVGYCDLYRLDKHLFERLLTHYPDVAAQIEAMARVRRREG